MKKILVLAIFAVVLLSAVSADTVATIDVGYMLAGMELSYETQYEHSLVLNGSIWAGDDLKVFASFSMGYIFGYSVDDGVINEFYPTSNAQSFLSGDLLGGVGFRFFMGDSMLILAGFGVHTYYSLVEDYFNTYLYWTAGVGGTVNLVILFEQNMGLNIGIKAAYDPFCIKGYGSEFRKNVVITPYVGFAATIN